jgi:hypothetical protein
MIQNTEVQRLAQLRKKDNESDAEFMARMQLDPAKLAKWKVITVDGTMYGGPAARRYIGE